MAVNLVAPTARGRNLVWRCGDTVGATMANPVESLPESHLGTKEHWDQVYAYVMKTLMEDER